MATPGFSGTASSKAGRPLLSDNDSVYAWRNVLAANQKAYNAAHYPSTPLPATYRTLTKVSNVLIDAVWAVAFVAMGAAMSTGIWAPVSNTHTPTHSTTTTQRTRGRGTGNQGAACAAAVRVASTHLQRLSTPLAHCFHSLLCSVCVFSS